MPAGSETGGRLRLDTDLGMPTANAAGLPRRIVGALLPTATAGGGTQLGIGNALVETGLFGLVVPTGPMFSTYGIRFSDAAAAGAQQFVQLGVRYNDVAGRPEIYYILQDFVGGTVSTLGASLLAPPTGADQIQLTLSRPDVGTATCSAAGRSGRAAPPADRSAASRRPARCSPASVRAGAVLRRRGRDRGGGAGAGDAALVLAGLGLFGLSARRRKR